MIELPVRPNPIPHESLRGYMLRVGTVNGSPSEKNFLKYFGFPSTETLGPTPLDNKPYRYFAHALGLRLEDLSKWFNNDIFQQRVANNKTLLRINPRICPDCLRQQPFLKEIWDFTPFALCLQHHSELLDECPHCKSPLRWNRSHYLQCGTCDSALTRWPAKSITTGCYQSVLITFAQSKVTSEQSWIADLEQAANTIGRAVDFLSSAIPFASMPNAQLTHLYEQACRFLFACDRAQQIQTYQQQILSPLKDIGRQSLALRNPLDEAYCTSYATDQMVPPINFLEIQQLRLQYATKLQPQKHEDIARLLWASPNRVRNTRADDLEVMDAALVTQISWPHLAALLGVNPKRDRSPMKLFPQQKSTRHYWDSLFNLYDGFLLLEKVPLNPSLVTTKTKSSTFVPLFKKDRDLHLLHYGASQADLFEVALAKTPPVAFRTNSEAGFEDLLIDEYEIANLLEERLENLNHHLTLNQVARVCSVDIFCIKELIRENFLKATSEIADNQVENFVTHASWKAFYQKYFILTRWCRLHALFAARLVPQLQERGVVPAIVVGRPAPNRMLWAYDPTPEFEESLEYVAPNWRRRKPAY